MKNAYKYSDLFAPNIGEDKDSTSISSKIESERVSREVSLNSNIGETKGKYVLEFALPTSEEVHVIIFSPTGEIVREFSRQCKAEYDTHVFDLNPLPSGNYHASVITLTSAFTFRIPHN